MLEVIDPAIVIVVDGAISTVVIHIGGVELGNVIAVLIVSQLDFDGVAASDVGGLKSMIA